MKIYITDVNVVQVEKARRGKAATFCFACRTAGGKRRHGVRTAVGLLW